jgi:tripartite-type tricarboxylate transporter receptor subunit TctC
MSRAAVETLNAELRSAMADPELQAQMRGWGIALSPGTAEEFGQLISSESRRWKEVVKRVAPRLD